MKTVGKIILCGWVVCFVSVGAAFAEKGEGGKDGKRDPAKMFEKIDTDGNGSLSLEEFTAGHDRRVEKMKERHGDRPEGARTPPSADKVFEKMDTDGDGSISLEEFTESIKNRKGAKEGKGAKKGKGGDVDGGDIN